MTDSTVKCKRFCAARGSVIQILGTGEGQTLPGGVTGSITQSANKVPALPVPVTIGGIDAVVQYACSAPGEVAGVLQVNATVPAGATPGAAVPITIAVGGVRSPDGVTIAVQ